MPLCLIKYYKIIFMWVLPKDAMSIPKAFWYSKILNDIKRSTKLQIDHGN